MLNTSNCPRRLTTRVSNLLRRTMIPRGCLTLITMMGFAGCDIPFGTVALGVDGTPMTETELRVNPESYALIGVSQLEVVAKLGVIANDMTADAVEPFTGQTEQGGMIDLAADGSFFYSAPERFLGTDYVEYRVYMNGMEMTGRAAFKIYPAEATPVPSNK